MLAWCMPAAGPAGQKQGGRTSRRGVGPPDLHVQVQQARQQRLARSPRRLRRRQLHLHRLDARRARRHAAPAAGALAAWPCISGWLCGRSCICRRRAGQQADQLQLVGAAATAALLE